MVKQRIVSHTQIMAFFIAMVCSSPLIANSRVNNLETSQSLQAADPDLNDKLFEASKGGTQDQIRSLIQAGADVNAPEADAWDKLHVVSQRYLEMNAKFYCLDDDGRLWYRKIFMQDEESLARLSKPAREKILEARNSNNAPAWHCLDLDITLNVARGADRYIADLANESVMAKRRSVIKGDDSNSQVYVAFGIFRHLSGGRSLIGSLIDEHGNATHVKLDALPDAELYGDGDIVDLGYHLIPNGRYKYSYHRYPDRFDRGNIAHEWIPSYKVMLDNSLEQRFPVMSPSSVVFATLTQQELAQEIADRNLISLPEWRMRRISNPEYKDGNRKAELDTNIFTIGQRYVWAASPPEFIFTWTKMSIKLRFTD